MPWSSQVDGDRQPDIVFEDVKAVFVQLNIQVVSIVHILVA